MFGTSVPLLQASDGKFIFLERVEQVIQTALQPITDLRSGNAHGFETLVRNTEALGFSSIPEFFAFADRLGVRAEVDALLFTRSALKLSQKAGVDALLFVNLDRKRAAQIDEMLPAMMDGLRAGRLTPFDISIEITEGGDAPYRAGLISGVAKLRSLGFRIAIDDFGTGHSGLQTLYELQPDYVKIDRFFISDIDRDARKRAFLSRLVELAHTFGTQVVAEGVERAGELHACRDCGCDLVQGYFIARPSVDAADLKQMYPAVADNSDRRKSQRGTRTLDDEGIVVALEAFSGDTRLDQVVEYFLGHPDCTFLPVVDARSTPIGVVRERDLRFLVQAPFGRDLLKNAAFRKPLADFVTRLPVVDHGISAAHLIERCVQSIEEGVIVTKDARYFGFVPATALLTLAGSIRLRAAQNQNPLTHLPANDAIIGHIGRGTENRGRDHAFAYLDFNNFKPFNDVYGFHVGDRAIIMFAEILRAEFGRDDAFVGHIGGDDFFVGLSGEVGEFAQRLRAVCARFSANAESLYSASHRQSGYIECAGRDGVVAQFPLLSCSIALLMLPAEGQPVTTDDIAHELSGLKMAAKRSPTCFSAGTMPPADRSETQKVDVISEVA